MSHFALLVIGDNVEKQLEPFDENMELDVYERYTKKELIENERESIENYKNGTYAEFLADPEKYKEDCKNDKHIEYVKNEFPKKLNWTDEQLYAEATQYLEKDDFSEGGGELSTYNPKSQWDWYQIGGRYAGRLMVKEEVEALESPNFSYGWDEESKTEVLAEPRTDSATKGNIDWSKIHATKESYDKAIRFWELKVEGAEPKDEDEKNLLKHDWYKDEYYTDRYKNKETYAKCTSNFTMWCILKDGKWIEKGDMGWWGMSGESNDEAVDWDLNFYDNFIKDLPEDTLLTVVDCHI